MEFRPPHIFFMITYGEYLFYHKIFQEFLQYVYYQGIFDNYKIFVFARAKSMNEVTNLFFQSVTVKRAKNDPLMWHDIA